MSHSIKICLPQNRRIHKVDRKGVAGKREGKWGPGGGESHAARALRQRLWHCGDERCELDNYRIWMGCRPNPDPADCGDERRKFDNDRIRTGKSHRRS